MISPIGIFDNRDNDADDFLKNCSYTGLNLDKNK